MTNQIPYSEIKSSTCTEGKFDPPAFSPASWSTLSAVETGQLRGEEQENQQVKAAVYNILFTMNTVNYPWKTLPHSGLWNLDRAIKESSVEPPRATWQINQVPFKNRWILTSPPLPKPLFPVSSSPPWEINIKIKLHYSTVVGQRLYIICMLYVYWELHCINLA